MSEMSDGLKLKNEALSELALAVRHVIIGFHKDAKWVGGKLSLVKGIKAIDKTYDLSRPMIWKLEQYLPPRVAGYEKPVEVFFITPDVAWWAPATPKKSDKESRERLDREVEEATARADQARRQRRSKR